MTSGAQTPVFSAAFPSLFYLFKEQKEKQRAAQKFISFSPSFLFLFPRARRFVYLSLPGWCLNQLRGGGLRSLLVCGKGHAVFFQRKRESKRLITSGGVFDSN